MDITREPFEIAPGPHTFLRNCYFSGRAEPVEGIWQQEKIAEASMGLIE